VLTASSFPRPFNQAPPTAASSHTTDSEDDGMPDRLNPEDMPTIRGPKKVLNMRTGDLSMSGCRV